MLMGSAATDPVDCGVVPQEASFGAIAKRDGNQKLLRQISLAA
jgi:hypothetical protein